MFDRKLIFPLVIQKVNDRAVKLLKLYFKHAGDA